MSFVLLTLPQVSLRSNGTCEVGSLAVECISSNTNLADAKTDTNSSEVTLGFHLGSHSLELKPGSLVKLVISQDGQRAYTFEPANEKSGVVHLIIPPPTEDAPHVAQDIETFDHLLTQYTDLSWTFDLPEIRSVPPPLPARTGYSPQPGAHDHQTNIKANVEQAKPVEDSDLRGHLVLMDESNGDILGELPTSLHLTEDPALPNHAQASDAVVLEMQPEMYDACTGAVQAGMIGEDLREAREVIVRAVPPEEQDWLMKSATLVRYAKACLAKPLLTGLNTAKPSQALPHSCSMESPLRRTTTSHIRVPANPSRALLVLYPPVHRPLQPRLRLCSLVHMP
jgi:spartin